MNQSLLSESARNNPTLITGCRLVIPSEGKSLWGDLWMVGECFVFNGVLDGKGQALWDWQYDCTEPPVFCKAITLIHGAPYFERRSVVVFEALHATFNEPAREYLKQILEAQ